MSNNQYQACPNCSTKIEVHTGYITWCPCCEWNLRKESIYKPKNIIEMVNLNLGKNFDDKFHQEQAATLTSKSAITMGFCFSYVLAFFVHVMTFATLGLALWLFVISKGNWLLYGLALLSVAVFWILKPFNFKKDQVNGISEADFPELHEMVRSLKALLGISNPYEILIDYKYNASIRRIKNSKKRVLTIGLPLWNVLTPDERVALLAHELAHDVNGDITRETFIYTALYTLSVWYALCKADPKPYGIVETLFWYISIGFKRLIKMGLEGYAWLMLMFVWRDSQRAEYLADYYAAEVAGSDAVLNLLRKFYMDDQVNSVIATATLNNTSDEFFTALKSKFDNVPSNELERIKRLEQNAGIRLDASHPPTNKRQIFINNNFVHYPKYNLSRSHSQKIDKELHVFENDIIHKLVDDYRYSLMA